MALFVKAAISLSEVIHILETPPRDPEKIITAPPCKPKGGQAFLFQTDKDAKQGKGS